MAGREAVEPGGRPIFMTADRGLEIRSVIISTVDSRVTVPTGNFAMALGQLQFSRMK